MKLPDWRVLNLAPGQLKPTGKNLCRGVSSQKLCSEKLFWEEEEVLWGNLSNDPASNMLRVGAVRWESDRRERYFAKT